MLRFLDHEATAREMLKCSVISDLYSKTREVEKGRRKVEEWKDIDAMTTSALHREPAPSRNRPQVAHVTVWNNEEEEPMQEKTALNWSAVKEG
jgi:hypothetical protein